MAEDNYIKEEVVEPVAPTETATPTAPKKKMKLWMKILIGIVVFIVGVIVLAFTATADVVKPVEGQLAALKSGDIAKAYSYTSKDFQNATSLEVFTKFVNTYPSLSKNDSHTFTDRSIENNQGTVKGSLKATDGTVTPVEYSLVKENGEWKIINLVVNPGASTNQ